jgi:hypothetical protein
MMVNPFVLVLEQCYNVGTTKRYTGVISREAKVGLIRTTTCYLFVNDLLMIVKTKAPDNQGLSS